MLFIPSVSNATDEKDFEVKTTRNLINLCTTASDEPLFTQAINFCHGYLVGAYHYHAVSGRQARRS